MSKGRKAIVGVVGGAGLVALVVFVALGWAQRPAGAAGLSGASTSSEAAERAALDTIFARFAARLGTDEATIDAAFVAAMSETVDEAARNGQVSAEEAEEVKVLVAKGGLKGFIIDQRDNGTQQNQDTKDRALVAAYQAAATTLGLDARQMKEQLARGNSLAAIAQDRNIATPTLRATMLAAAKGELNRAVRDGEIGQADADVRLADLTRIVDGLINEGARQR